MLVAASFPIAASASPVVPARLLPDRTGIGVVTCCWNRGGGGGGVETSGGDRDWGWQDLHQISFVLIYCKLVDSRVVVVKVARRDGALQVGVGDER